MNEIRRPDRSTEEIARANEIVSRHPLPDFISRFEVQLGTMDGDPALYIYFYERPVRRESSAEEVFRRSEALGRLDAALLPELFDGFPDRLPYSFSRTEKDG